jgi:hypothetical protein
MTRRWSSPSPASARTWPACATAGFITAERRGKEVIYRLALGGLGAILEGSAEVMAPLAERLATCTRIGPEWV